MGSATRSALIALVLLVFAGIPAFAQEPETAVGYIVAIQGSGTVERGGAVLDLQEGAVIGTADQILTGVESQVLLVLNDGSRVVIGAETRVTMAILAAAGASGDGDRVIDLLQGILRISVHASEDGNGVETRTPTAVVAARSTAWIVAFEGDSTAVLSLEGTVEVASTTAPGAVTLTPGYGTDVARGAAPTEPVTWGAARADAFRDRTAFSGAL